MVSTQNINLAKIFITIVIVDINKPLMQFFIVIG